MMFQVGQARVTVLSIGDLRADLRRWLSRPELPEPAVALPVQNIHLALPSTVVLVDAGRYAPSDPDFRLPDYVPPPDLLTQLRARGLAPEAVEHVVLTHAHFDHYLGVTSQGQPSFPRARHYLGAADWEAASQQAAFEDTLGLLERRGLLELVDGERDLGHGLRILPAPGETPGHQVLRLRSQGQTLYCLGDLYHHETEFAHPEWDVYWADPTANQASRRWLVAAALKEQALLIPAHVRPGRLLGPTLFAAASGD